MFHRREVVGLGAALLLAGCGVRVPRIEVDLDYPVIDVHGHIFNGKDVPVVGFLDQVVLRSAHQPVQDPGLKTALVRLLTFVLREAALTPDEELRTYRTGLDAAARVPGRRDAADEAAVARALARYRAALRTQSESLPLDGSPSDDARLITEIYGDEALLDATPGLDETADEAAARRIFQSEDGTYVRLSGTYQSIRWAGMLTRPRIEILGEYIRLYSRNGPVGAVSPSVLDFELWFREDESVSSLEDQVEVMSALAKRTEDVLVLNFLQFCPLRAALSPSSDRRLFQLLDEAIDTQGFAGVKLYPPLGYKPFLNSQSSGTFGGKPGQTVSGDRIDAALARLYDWCVRRNVPIKSHATNSNDAGQCSALFGSPEHWKPVLQKWPALKINLAHFGDFDEDKNEKKCDGGEIDWEELIAQTIDGGATGLYADLGYWTDAYIGSFIERRRIRFRLQRILSDYPKLAGRLMFGTDWSMLGREPTHVNYVGQIRRVMGQVGLNEEAVFRTNALRYLGLDSDTQQRRRLTKFFGEDRLARGIGIQLDP